MPGPVENNPYAKRKADTIAKESESAAKAPKTEVSPLVLLIREFVKTLPKIDKSGQFYSVPKGSSGRSALAKSSKIPNPADFIAAHLPNHPYYNVPSPDIRAAQTKVQGDWSTETKLKAMMQFTIPEGFRILVIYPELAYYDLLKKNPKFAVKKDGKCGVLPPCDQGVRMTVELNGDRYAIISATWCCGNPECQGLAKHQFSTLKEEVWKHYPEVIRNMYNAYLGGLETDSKITLASRKLCHHLITSESDAPTEIASKMESYYTLLRDTMKGQYLAFIVYQREIRWTGDPGSAAPPRDTMRAHFRPKTTSAQAKTETWHDWPHLDYAFLDKYFKGISRQTLIKLQVREYESVRHFFRRDILSRPADEIIRWDGTYKLMMKMIDDPDCEESAKVLLILVGKLGHILFWAFAEQEDSKSWQRINLLLLKRTMRIDPTGELARKVIHAYSDTCCGESPTNPKKHWVTKVWPNMKRAPGKDPFHACKLVTDSTNPKNPLHQPFCKLLAQLLVRNDRESEQIALVAFRKENKGYAPEVARQTMNQTKSYTRCIENASVPIPEVVEGANRLKEEFKKKDEELRLASYIADGPHHYKAYFTHEIHGKQRGTEAEIANFIRHAENGCYEDPLSASKMSVNARATPPEKGNGLMPLFSLRGSGMVESTNWLVQLTSFESKKLSAKTVHMRLDIRFTKFNIDKDIKFEHITGRKPHSFNWFLEEEFLKRSRCLLAEEPYYDDSSFPADIDLDEYDEPLGMDFMNYSKWDEVQAEVDSLIAGDTDFVTASLQSSTASNRTREESKECNDHLADNYEKADEDDDTWPAGEAASVAPQSPTMLPPPLRSPPPVDTAPQQRSDMAYGSGWGRTLGGHGRVTLPTVMYHGPLDDVCNRKSLFLGMVADAQTTFGEISDSMLAEKVVIAWRDAHYDLIENGVTYGLGGNLSADMVQKHLRVLGKQLWDTKMNVYPQILPPPPRPYYPAPAAPRFHPHQYQHSRYPAPAAARFFDPYQHPGVATAAAAGPYPDQHRSVTSLARQPESNASESEIVVSRTNLETQSLVTLKRALVSIQATKIFKDKPRAIECLRAYFKRVRDKTVVIRLPRLPPK
jgi:hypothetical protein